MNSLIRSFDHGSCCGINAWSQARNILEAIDSKPDEATRRALRLWIVVGLRVWRSESLPEFTISIPDICNIYTCMYKYLYIEICKVAYTCKHGYTCRHDDDDDDDDDDVDDDN